MSEESKLNRRKFIGAGAAGVAFVAAGSVIGWVATRDKNGTLRKGNKPGLDSRFTYDVSAFERTDPSMLLYEESGQIATGFQEPKCLATDHSDRIYVGGDQTVKIFGNDGKLQSTVNPTGKPHAIEPFDDGRLCVGLKDHFEIFDQSGKSLLKGNSLGDKVYITAIAHTADMIFIADAGNREVIRCDMNAQVVSRFGKVGAQSSGSGFVVPSPYFDLMFGDDGLLWVANPGRHRVEAYTPEGEFEIAWGKTSMAVEGFCGCCNPVYFTRLPDGRFVTSEKGLNRIKIHNKQGDFEGVVAGPEHLVKDIDLARKACANCEIGFGFDVACDSSSRVFALDQATKTIRIFTARSA